MDLTEFVKNRFESWIDFYGHINQHFPEKNDLEILKLQFSPPRDISVQTGENVPKDDYIEPIEFTFTKQELKAKCFDEINSTVNLSMKTYLEISRMPCAQNAEIRQFFTDIFLLTKLSK